MNSAMVPNMFVPAVHRLADATAAFSHLLESIQLFANN